MTDNHSGMGLRLKWSVIAQLEQLAYCNTPNLPRTVQTMMVSPARRSSAPLGHLLALRSLVILFLIALCPCVPFTFAGQVPTTRSQSRYSGCNVISMYGSCDVLNRPDFVDNFINQHNSSPLRIHQRHCLSMLAYLRCALFKMACRSPQSQTDLISQAPCQVSCEQALESCTPHVLDHTAWDHLRVSDCKFLPAGGCLDWTTSNRRRSTTVAKRRNEFCRTPQPSCNRMFPSRSNFKRRQWRNGNFSIVVDVVIKSVMWYFQNNRIHSYVITEVKRPYKSNIGLERGLQYTLQWPFKCYCKGQILVGHRYILLTHSIDNAHEFNVSVNTVFLPKKRKIKKRLMCWINHRRCRRSRQRQRNEGRRRRRSINKRRRLRFF